MHLSRAIIFASLVVAAVNELPRLVTLGCTRMAGNGRCGVDGPRRGNPTWI